MNSLRRRAVLGVALRREAAGEFVCAERARGAARKMEARVLWDGACGRDECGEYKDQF
jgi:hypothetical protein